MRKGPSPTDDEDLRKKLRHPDGPSRGNYDEEEEAIDLTTADPETDEDDDYKNEGDGYDSIDDDDSDDEDDDSSDINDFLW